MAAKTSPFIVGLGGTTRQGSSSELALKYALSVAASHGAHTRLFAGPDLVLRMYAPESPERCSGAERLIEALRQSDGVIIASPGYHGSLSGLIKNALDYVEDMREDELPYLHGRAVGCIACAYGAQATGTTLVALRSVVHALRGWPTPLGVAVNSSTCRFQPDGTPTDAPVREQLTILGEQVVEFTRLRAMLDSPVLRTPASLS
jgi:FMN reductase